jgi:RimJ/RimL family protein N-acetyltransferase
MLDVRPIDPGDRDRLAAFFARLSPRSRFERFLAPKKRLLPAELDRLTDVDHVRHEALVAIDPAEDRIVAVARYAEDGDGPADVAFCVADDRRGEGLATMLGRLLLDRAAANGIPALGATTLADNRACRALLERLGFRTAAVRHGLAELSVTPARRPAGTAAAPR